MFALPELPQDFCNSSVVFGRKRLDIRSVKTIPFPICQSVDESSRHIVKSAFGVIIVPVPSVVVSNVVVVCNILFLLLQLGSRFGCWRSSRDLLFLRSVMVLTEVDFDKEPDRTRAPPSRA